MKLLRYVNIMIKKIELFLKGNKIIFFFILILINFYIFLFRKEKKQMYLKRFLLKTIIGEILKIKFFTLFNYGLILL
jgi:hypothetical protein